MMKTENNLKLRGSVLFTVVFVMSILIVFLFGTLTLASATNNRAHVNYNSAQTGITARSVAESAVMALSNGSEGGKAYAAAVDGVGKAPKPQSMKVKVSLTDTSNKKLGSMGSVEPLEIKYAGSKMYYNVGTGVWEEKDIISFTATVVQNGVESQATVYTLRGKTPAINEDGGGGAGFVTVAGASLDCSTSLFGGSYINLPKWNNAANELDFYQNLSSKVNSGSSSYLGVELFPAYNESDMKTFLYGRNAGTEIETDICIYSNLKTLLLGGFYFSEVKKGAAVWGDMVVSTNSENFTFAPGVKLEQYYTHNASEAGTVEQIAFNQMPYLYVNGAFKGATDRTGKFTLGNKSNPFPLNFFFGTIDLRYSDVVGSGSYSNFNQNNITIVNDLFLMDAGGDNHLELAINSEEASSSLYNWFANVKDRKAPDYEKASTDHTRSIYCNGDIVINNTSSDGTLQGGESHIYGDLRVQGNATVHGKIHVHGNVAVGGTLDIGSDVIIDGKLYVDPDKLEGPGASKYKTGEVIKRTVTYENLTGYYYTWPLANGVKVIDEENGNSRTVFCHPDGSLVGGDGATLNGVELNSSMSIIYTLAEGVKPSDIVPGAPGMEGKILYDVDIYFSDEDIDKIYEDEGERDAQKAKRPRAGGADDQFYIKTTLDPDFTITVSDVAEDGSISDELRAQLNNSRIPDGYAKTNDATNTKIVVSGGVAGEWPDFAKDYSNAKIYPDFARREVILGLEAVDGMSLSETKIVKTIREVQDKVANPYKYDFRESDSAKTNWPTSFKEGYDRANAKVFKSLSELENAAEYTANNVASDIATNGSITYTNGNPKKTLETEISTLEAEKAALESEISSLQSQSKWDEANAKNNELNTLNQKINDKKAALNNVPSNDCIVISKDCRLCLTDSGAKPGITQTWSAGSETMEVSVSPNADSLGTISKNVILRPADSTEMVVIIDYLALADGYGIIVDDTGNGIVDLYISDGGGLFIKGAKNGLPGIGTVKYLRDVRNDSVSYLKLNSNEIIDKMKTSTNDDDKNFIKDITDHPDSIVDLPTVGKPRVNVYGDQNSFLDFGNYTWAAANIISPGLGVKIAATTGTKSYSKILYNNEDMMNPQAGGDQNDQVVFGCINANKIALPNKLNVIYVPDKGKLEGDGGNTPGGNAYAILYYDES